jgi:hypothetical protein
MPPFERYLPKDSPQKEGKERREQSSFLISSLDEARREEIKASLRSLHQRKRAETVLEARARVKRQIEAGATALEGQKEHKERRELREKAEISAVNEYNRIWDFRYNVESYHGEGGWKERYQQEIDPEDGLPVREKMSIELFVRTRHIEALEQIRAELITERLDRRLDAIYPQFAAETSLPEEREQKLMELSERSNQYVQNHRADLEALMQLSPEKKEAKKNEMLAVFRLEVFPDLTPDNQTANAEIAQLFAEMIADFEDMQNAIYQLDALNDRMVTLLSDPNITEEQWLAELAKESEAELEKIKQEEAANAGQPQYFDYSGSQVNFGQINFDYSGQISAAEKLAPDTKIAISMVTPGQFKIRFPSVTDVTMESYFKVGQRENEQGQLEVVYLFDDPLQDAPKIVTEQEFLAMVNGVYLEHLMSDSVRKGSDYLGPDLNTEALRDQKMLNLAQKLFQPKRIDRMAMTEEQAGIFRKLLVIVTNKSNNEKGAGDYGDLLAVGTRIDLLMLALENPQNAQKCYNLLKESSQEYIRNISVEKLCRQIGLPKNSGNFARS